MNNRIGCGVQLRTGAWHGDAPLDLEFPSEWDVDVRWPRTPPPLAEREIAEALEHPVNQPPLRKLCAGRKRPLIVVDDLNRPTPAFRVMPFVLSHLDEAGIPPGDVTILVASGMHGAPSRDAMIKKVGPEAAAACRLVAHDFHQGTVKIGKTSFGTPVVVNREVMASDCVLGIGGIYPNHTAGFGGGSKLALGVLGEQSISHLHYRHTGAGWGVDKDNSFRKDLDEIARLLQWRSMISLHINSSRDPVHVHCGDHFSYYRDALSFSQSAYSVPSPGEADVVVSNAYPMDLSLTFARMKGMAPLQLWAKRGASRVAIASCSEGMGEHNLFPFPSSRLDRVRARARRLATMRLSEVAKKAGRRWVKSAQERFSTDRRAANHPIWLCCTGASQKPLPASISELRMAAWPEILDAVRMEQQPKEHPKVAVYPCAPIQVLEV